MKQLTQTQSDIDFLARIKVAPLNEVVDADGVITAAIPDDPGKTTFTDLDEVLMTLCSDSGPISTQRAIARYFRLKYWEEQKVSAFYVKEYSRVLGQRDSYAEHMTMSEARFEACKRSLMEQIETSEQDSKKAEIDILYWLRVAKFRLATIFLVSGVLGIVVIGTLINWIFGGESVTFQDELRIGKRDIYAYLATKSDETIAMIYAANQDGKMEDMSPCGCLIGVGSSSCFHGYSGDCPNEARHYLDEIRLNKFAHRAEGAYMFVLSKGCGSGDDLQRNRLSRILRAEMRIRARRAKLAPVGVELVEV